jgi:hypothetical protein
MKILDIEEEEKNKSLSLSFEADLYNLKYIN